MAKQSKTAKRKSIPRQTRRFQLRLNHPQDTHVKEILDYARSEKREVTVIREAVELFWALENGNLDALFEKFPQYKAKINSSGGEGQLDEFMQMLASMVADGNQYLMKSARPSMPVMAHSYTEEETRPMKPIVLESVTSKAPTSSATITANMLSAFD